MQLSSERRYHFACQPDEVWRALSATGDYQQWWPWLRQFEAAGLVAGDRWSCTVRPPLPYSLRFTIELTEVVPCERIAADVTGDIAGTARIEIAPEIDGSAVWLTSALTPSSRVFAALATLARPIVTRGHDWVLDTGAEQFRAHVSPSEC